MDHQALGKKGEELACNFLQAKGFEILDRNWVFRKEELDAVTEKDGRLVFVEVKTRNGPFSEPLYDIITPKKQKALLRAAEAYYHLHERQEECRFDVVLVEYNEHGPEFRHYEEAFFPSV